MFLYERFVARVALEVSILAAILVAAVDVMFAALLHQIDDSLY